MRFWFGSKKENDSETPVAAPADTNAPAEAPAPAPAPASEPVAATPVAPTNEVKPAAEEKPAAEPAPASAPGAIPLPATPNVVKEAVAAKQAAATGAPAPRENVKDLYYKLMNSLYDAVLVLDANGRIIDSNNRVESVLGYTPADMWDKPVSDIAHGLTVPIMNQIKEAIGANHPVILDARCTRKDGTKFSAEIAICRIYLTRGENYTLTLRNIDKRIAALRQKIAKEMAAASPDAPTPNKVVKLRVVKRPQQAQA